MAQRSDAAIKRDRGYTAADMAEVSDNLAWTEAEFARAKPFDEVCPDLVASLSCGVDIMRVEGSVLRRAQRQLYGLQRKRRGIAEKRLYDNLGKASRLA